MEADGRVDDGGEAAPDPEMAAPPRSSILLWPAVSPSARWKSGLVKANDCAVLLMRIACTRPDTGRVRNLVVGIPLVIMPDPCSAALGPQPPLRAPPPEEEEGCVGAGRAVVPGAPPSRGRVRR